MKFNTMVKKFVYFLENKGQYNQRYAEMILEASTAWNKEYLLKELERQVLIFIEYEESKDNKKVEFNYLPFCEKFMTERPPTYSLTKKE